MPSPGKTIAAALCSLRINIYQCFIRNEPLRCHGILFVDKNTITWDCDLLIYSQKYNSYPNCQGLSPSFWNKNEKNDHTKKCAQFYFSSIDICKRNDCFQLCFEPETCFKSEGIYNIYQGKLGDILSLKEYRNTFSKQTNCFGFFFFLPGLNPKRPRGVIPNFQKNTKKKQHQKQKTKTPEKTPPKSDLFNFHRVLFGLS